MRLKDRNHRNYNSACFIKWIIMMMSVSLWEYGIQPGYIIIYDGINFSFTHCVKTHLPHIKAYIEFGKYAPIRVLKIVIVNSGPVVDKLINITRPLFAKESSTKLEVFRNPSDFFKTEPPDTVPLEYGGEGPSLTYLHEKCVLTVQRSREWLIKEEVTRSKRTSREAAKALRLDAKHKKSVSPV